MIQKWCAFSSALGLLDLLFSSLVRYDRKHSQCWAGAGAGSHSSKPALRSWESLVLWWTRLWFSRGWGHFMHFPLTWDIFNQQLCEDETHCTPRNICMCDMRLWVLFFFFEKSHIASRGVRSTAAHRVKLWEHSHYRTGFWSPLRRYWTVMESGSFTK